MIELSDRETATVLAALRYWQGECGPESAEAADIVHFDECDPLTLDEIDWLCERLNARQQGAGAARPRCAEGAALDEMAGHLGCQ